MVIPGTSQSQADTFLVYYARSGQFYLQLSSSFCQKQLPASFAARKSSRSLGILGLEALIDSLDKGLLRGAIVADPVIV